MGPFTIFPVQSLGHSSPSVLHDLDTREPTSGTAGEFESEEQEELKISLGLVVPSSTKEFSSVVSLLAHYISQLADILQPIHHPQNPFHTIHVQYAIANLASTDPMTRCPSFIERCPPGNKAIFHSLISTSAFHLRGHHIPVKHRSWAMYDDIGRVHRLQALKWLQHDLGKPPEDEEALYASMSASLTLVTSDVSFDSHVPCW